MKAHVPGWLSKKYVPQLLLFFLIQLSLFQFSQAQTFELAKQIGGTNSDIGKSVVIDGSGNVYTAGTFSGTVDFDPGPQTFELTTTGQAGVFITKLNAAGNFIWAKHFNAPYDIGVSTLALDGSGNIYVGGDFSGTADFNPGPTSFTLSAPAGSLFISKLDGSGNFVWAKHFGNGTSNSNSVLTSIAVDGSGSVGSIGYFYGTVDFDPGQPTFSLSTTSTGGASDIFISKLDASGNFTWAKQIGNFAYDYAYGIAFDASNHIYITGPFLGTVDFDPGAGTFNMTSGSAQDVFVEKLDPAGNFAWAVKMGGNGRERGLAIAVDNVNNVYVTGGFDGVGDYDPGPGVFELTPVGQTDVYVAKLDFSGNLVWAKQFGGTEFDESNAIGVDGAGNVYTSGRFSGTVDFDPGAGTFNLSGGNSFVSKINASGGFVWAKQVNATVNSFDLDSNNDVYTTGAFAGSVNFDAFTLVSAGSDDAFIGKIGPCNLTAPTLTANAPISNQPISVTATGCAGTINWTPTGGTGQANGNIYTFSLPGSYSLSAICTQGNCTSPVSNIVSVQVLAASFAITSVNMIQCQQVNASRGQYQVRFNPLYSGANANPISFSVTNEMVSTTNSGPYTLVLFNDNPIITLVANQAGNGETRYQYNWLASCQTGSSPNQAPTTSGIPNQNLTQNQPYQLNLTSYFSDPDGQPLTFTDQGLPAGLSRNGALISGTPSTTGVSTVNITALDPGGLSVSTSFQLSVNATPVTPPSGFAINGVSPVSCQLLSPNRYRITFNPQYVGRDVSQPFSFSVHNELSPTSNPGPYSLDLYTDNPTIRLMASQGTSVSQFTYSWTSGCQTPARQGVSEPGTGLQVRVLGNPVVGNMVEVDVQGANAQPLTLRLINLQGQLIDSKSLEQATNQERIRLEIGETRGLLLLQVNTPTQQQQQKVLKL